MTSLYENEKWFTPSDELVIEWYLDPEVNGAVLPTKRDEDDGYDIYTVEDGVVLNPHETRLFSTGVYYNIPNKNLALIVKDRGSTGSNGIHVHCGVCDMSYRGEIFVALCNTNDDITIVFTSQEKSIIKEERDGQRILYYPISKAVAQLVPILHLPIKTKKIDSNLWNEIKNNSERKQSKLGSSNK